MSFNPFKQPIDLEHTLKPVKIFKTQSLPSSPCHSESHTPKSASSSPKAELEEDEMAMANNNNNNNDNEANRALKDKPLEDIMSTLVGQVSSLAQSTQDLKVSTQAFMNKIDHSIANLETQVGWIAAVINQRELGKLPSQVVVNPKDLNNARVNVITLRSGKKLKSTKEP
ncbi:hypothetical protein D8674_037158 [Pyrus ussuriensis x Pyrus communis]|uniref:Uncharacterized protein n=1 Tax=Pyrus ussuriensis x Pyrus communis TaxID=2448454 RepID=A0A5N5FTC6_9ROSA|nr:hypothetical protein D8674_037158 [Pyrus ussuriensis x Pyrus communis]